MQTEIDLSSRNYTLLQCKSFIFLTSGVNSDKSVRSNSGRSRYRGEWQPARLCFALEAACKFVSRSSQRRADGREPRNTASLFYLH
jgi:hypothetical protein